MKNFLKSYWKALLFFTLAGIVGGFCCGLYLLDSYPPEIVQEITDQGLTPFLVGVVSAYQAAGYGLVLGTLGILLGKKTGLWKDQRSIAKKPLVIAVCISLVCGLAMILPDMLYFAPRNQAILDSYAVKPTLTYILAAVTYGAVIEEVMLRLFFMSLVAFILHKLFGKKQEKPSAAMLVAANVIAALLFAAAHLPATVLLLGNSPMLIFRCFLLNGGIGLLLGYLYRRHGLRYAMIAHGGCHVVSKVIWILFI